MSFCRECGERLPAREGLEFCPACGAPVARREPPSRSRPAEDGGTPSGGSWSSVIFVCAAVSLVGWIPLSLPSLFLNGLIADAVGIYGLCDAVTSRTGSPQMFACSAVVGMVTIALGPLATAVGLYLVRKQVARLLRRALSSLREDRAYLVPPILATALFMVAWAGTHYTTALSFGFLPNLLFPVVVGLFTYLTVKHSGSIRASLSLLFRIRDLFPKVLRWGAVVAVPTAFALAITVYFPDNDDLTLRAVREQSIVLVSLVAGYLLLVPAQGDPLEKARQMAKRFEASLADGGASGEHRGGVGPARGDRGRSA